MSDRELLELAAKAAGINLWPGDAWRTITPSFSGLLLRCGHIVWRPHQDDGDTLRLAMAIPACVVIDNDMGWCGIHLNASRGKYDFVEEFGSDKSAATRRAVLRAAAEIGKNMGT